jgi:hypothetical protein
MPHLQVHQQLEERWQNAALAVPEELGSGGCGPPFILWLCQLVGKSREHPGKHLTRLPWIRELRLQRPA